MKIVFVVYHDLSTEARSAEMLESLEMLGDVEVVSIAPLPSRFRAVLHYVPYSDTRRGVRYIRFIRKAKEVIRSVQPNIIVLHDCINLIRYAKKTVRNARVVCDQSELKIDRKNDNLTNIIQNLIAWIERRNVKIADVFICANADRAQISMEYYHLSTMPIVFDNMHQIKDVFDINACNDKFARYFFDGKINIVYGGGISEARMTYILMEAVWRNKDMFNLIVCGAAPEGMQKFNMIVREMGEPNCIKYIGFVKREEWRYLLSRADVSFVAFEQNCLNNIYCASGKAYESLFEGTPIITSTNPPLKRLCDLHHVGISSDDYNYALKEFAKNKMFYKRSTVEYANTLDYDGRIKRLADSIIEALDAASEYYHG